MKMVRMSVMLVDGDPVRVFCTFHWVYKNMRIMMPSDCVMCHQNSVSSREILH